MSEPVAPTYPTIRQVVLDCPNPRALAEFYRELYGLVYREGDEPPPAGRPDARGSDWLVLHNPAAAIGLSFQAVDNYAPPTWPEGPRGQMIHLDTSVPNVEELNRQRARAVNLGATVLYDRSADENEPLYVFADPAGHPFCIFVAD